MTTKNDINSENEHDKIMTKLNKQMTPEQCQKAFDDFFTRVIYGEHLAIESYFDELNK